MQLITDIETGTTEIRDLIQNGHITDGEGFDLLQKRIRNIINVQSSTEYWSKFLIGSVWICVGLIGIIIFQK